MNTQKKTQFMTLTALLTAIAILIPLAMPFKIVIPPASYTPRFLHSRKPRCNLYCYVPFSLDGNLCHYSF